MVGKNVVDKIKSHNSAVEVLLIGTLWNEGTASSLVMQANCDKIIANFLVLTTNIIMLIKT